MSLINEALKKAQRRQHAEQTVDAAPTPGGQPIVKRGKIQSAQTMVLLACGGLLLVVLSVVATVWLLNRPSSEASPAQASPPPAATPSTTPSAAPVATPADKAPASPAPAVATAPATAPTATAPTPPPATPNSPSPLASAAPAPAAPSPVAASATPLAAAPASPAPAAASPLHGAPPKQDERALAFLDAVRIGGVRASGPDSRVLMNERVYRINDIVERSTGLRLTKVASETLSFVDAQGVTYERSF